MGAAKPLNACGALDQKGCSTNSTCVWGVTTSTPGPTVLPSRLCQPTVLGPGPNGGEVGGSLLVQWEHNGEFQMEWAVPTHKAYVMNLNPGYTGTMTWNYTTDPKAPNGDGKPHYYVYAIGQRIQKDGQDYGDPLAEQQSVPG